MARILLVEDEEPIRRLLKHILSEAGFTVVASYDGRIGLSEAILSEEPFDLVVTDGTMPNLDGTRMLHAMAITGYLPARVIVISGEQEAGFVNHLRDVMPRDVKFDFLFLAKPVRISPFLDAVNAMLVGKVE